MTLPIKTVCVALIAGSLSSFASSATAVPLSASLSLRGAADPAVQTVQWRRGWGGLGFGLAAAAIIGGAIASSSYYGYGYGYGYPGYAYSGYAPAYYSYGYAPAYYGYGYAPAYAGYAYAPAYAGYAYAYPRYRSGIYLRRNLRRW
jgi:hypothetical protein